MPRLTPQYLAFLRNQLAIEPLITTVLRLPTRHLDGHLRFPCPLCAAFHTAIHPTQNLARCFDCRKNFNTIDLVIAVRHLAFRDAVWLLERHQHVLTQSPSIRPAHRQVVTDTSPKHPPLHHDHHRKTLRNGLSALRDDAPTRPLPPELIAIKTFLGLK